jgi:hypothetical protein
MGDTITEPNEVFLVTLSNASGATISSGTGLEGILNDDPGSPSVRLAIGNVAIVEGQSGQRDAQFVVTLSAIRATPVTVHYATADGSATAGADYTAKAGTITFPAGSVARTVLIPIAGDSLHEGDENFTVTLSSASGATITQAVGTASILDDD